jgi:hypothetical protein
MLEILGTLDGALTGREVFTVRRHAPGALQRIAAPRLVTMGHKATFRARRPKGRSSAQFNQQRLRLLQIKGIEAFGEPVINRSEQFASLLHLALVAP